MLKLSHLLAFLADVVKTNAMIYDENVLLKTVDTQDYKTLEDMPYYSNEVKNYTILDDGNIKIVLKKEDK